MRTKKTDAYMHSDMNHARPCHSRESGNPGKDWIPDQVRNDEPAKAFVLTWKNQSGVALVIALIMIIVLTVIVLAASLTSIFEIKLAGNKRGATDAFFGADSGVQIVMSDPSNFDLPGKYDATGKYRYSEDAANKNLTKNPTRADIIIYHNSTQTGAPRGFGFSATGNYEFMHFLIESTGKDQVEVSPIKSTSVIHQKAVRLVPTLQGGN